MNFRMHLASRVLTGILIAATFSACSERSPADELPITTRSSLADLPHWKRPSAEQVEWLQGAKSALANGNTEEAFELLTRLRGTSTISLELRDGTLLYAELLEKRDRRSEALRVLSELSMQAPPDGDVLYILGRMYQRAGNIPEAERALRDATRAAPELLRAWIALADLLHSTNREAEAEETLIHYERQLYRLANVIERSSTQEERVAAINQLRVALPDPRISRVLSKALRNDSLEVQRAALAALERVGTSNAVPALEAFIQATPNPDVRSRAQEVLERLRR